ncbi:MAG: hypothetical protein HY509_03150, partial [Acidobacteria bacterium]|nr:hypothetical protein [Acidobacteriota bacterium]
PVLLVSALASEEVRARARSLGVVRILEKPVAAADLLACIRGILGPAAPEAPQESTPPAAAG